MLHSHLGGRGLPYTSSAAIGTWYPCTQYAIWKGAEASSVLSGWFPTNQRTSVFREKTVITVFYKLFLGLPLTENARPAYSHPHVYEVDY
jgi:hypothetical protein